MDSSERDPEPVFDDAWTAEIRRRVDAVIGGASKGTPWPQVKNEIAAQLAQRAEAKRDRARWDLKRLAQGGVQDEALAASGLDAWADALEAEDHR